MDSVCWCVCVCSRWVCVCACPPVVSGAINRFLVMALTHIDQGQSFKDTQTCARTHRHTHTSSRLRLTRAAGRQGVFNKSHNLYHHRHHHYLHYLWLCAWEGELLRNHQIETLKVSFQIYIVPLVRPVANFIYLGYFALCFGEMELNISLPVELQTHKTHKKKSHRWGLESKYY